MGIKVTEADRWFSKSVRQRDGWACRHCSTTDAKLECAHIYGRRYKSVRYCADNAVTLCHTCHRHFTENPLEFSQWLSEQFGDGALDILREKRNGILKATEAVRKEISKHYREEFRRMESNNTQDLVSWN